MKVKQVPREVAWRRRKRWSKAASPPSHPTAGVQLGKLESDPAGKVCKAPGAGTKASTAELSRLCLCSLPSSFPIQSIPRVLLSAQKKKNKTPLIHRYFCMVESLDGHLHWENRRNIFSSWLQQSGMSVEHI